MLVSKCNQAKFFAGKIVEVGNNIVRNFMHRFIAVFMSLVFVAGALPQTGR